MRDRLIELIVDSENEIYRENRYFTDTERIAKVADRLLANGVIIPPVKVGQTIYAIWSGGRKGIGIAEFEVRSINLDTPEDMEIVYRSKKLNATMVRYANASDFGKTLFLTREEAEKALERSKDGT